MDVRVLLLNAWILASSTKAIASPYFAVVAPNAIRFEHDETVSVNVFGTNNQQFSLWLEHNGKQFSEKTGTVVSEEQPATVTIRVTEADIFDHETLVKARHVTLKASCLGQVKEAELLVNYESGYIIVQTDKPIYSPGETVHFRVLALNEALHHEQDAQLAIDIIDPKNQVMRRTYARNDGRSPFFSDFFMIPNYAELSMWTIRAFFKGQFRTEERVTFSVEEKELPTFGVIVTPEANCLLQTMDEFEVYVRASYVYGKPVEGMVGLDLFLCNDKQGTKEFVMRTQNKADITWCAVDHVIVKWLPSASIRKRIFTPNKLDGGDSLFKISMDAILNSPAVKGDNRIQDFPPDGYYLEMVADVLEIVTGNENRGYAKVIFASKPYLFRFSKSKNSYNPGLIYTLQVQVQHANGKPVTQGVADVTMTNSMNMGVTKETGRIENGKLLAFFRTTMTRATTLTFQVTLDGLTSDYFEVDPYQGDDQVAIELVIHRGRPSLRIYSNVLGGADKTGILVMIIARGRIIKMNHYKMSVQRSMMLDDALLEMISPGARAVVFYINKLTGKVVSNSVQIEVTPRCKGSGLKLEPNRDVYRPGSISRLQLRGEEDMWVGLNAMDTSLLLMDDENILQTNKMFKLLGEHDLGCGAGGGINDSDVFKNAGVVVLTNAAVINERREAMSCNGNRGNIRKKRFILDESDYARDVREIMYGSSPRVRQQFRESWLFEEVKLDKDGFAEKRLLLPESISSWRIQGIGFTQGKGVCISEPVDIKVYKDFFIQLDMPYKAVRLDTISVRATIFNYFSAECEVHAYIEGVDGLCSSARDGETSAMQKAVVQGNSAVTFNFLVRPLRAGRFPVKIMTFATVEGIGINDGITKELQVVNEGSKVMKTIHACLSPLETPYFENDEDVYNVSRFRGELTMKIRLQMPEDAVPNTGHAVGYIKGAKNTDFVGKVIKGMEFLLRRPYGNGENIMFFLAPTVYSLGYIKQTKKVTHEIETKGNTYTRTGVLQELTYRHYDGSYAVWRHWSSSTWLTAFVVKVFSQARKVVDDSLDPELHIVPSLKWLLTRHNNGEFFERTQVIHRDMVGQIDERDSSLTAFVLISFLEFDSKTAEMNSTVVQAVRYLEGISKTTYNNNPFLLAITTYALALANSRSKLELMTMLKAESVKDGEKLYWGVPSGKPASANAVETTSYALLAYLNMGHIEESAHIVRWLIEQRADPRSFKTNMDTVVGLQALTEYSVCKDMEDVTALRVHVLYRTNIAMFNITSENAQVVKVVKELYGGNGEEDLIVRAMGSGTAYLTIDMTYNVRGFGEACPFTVSDIVMEAISDKPMLDEVIAQARYCDVCGVCRKDVDNIDIDYDDLFPFADFDPFANAPFPVASRQPRSSRPRRKQTTIFCVRFDISSDRDSDMVIVNFGLEIGVTVIKNDLDILLEKQPAIARYETPPNGEGYIKFYLDSVGPEAVNFTFRLSDTAMADADTRQMAKVDIYEKNIPEPKCTKFYSVGSQIMPAPYECDAKETNCVCLQNVCAENSERKLIRAIRRGGRPASVLRDRLCNVGGSAYAVLVQMDYTRFDPFTGYINVIGLVRKIIHAAGFEDLKVGWNMEFRYKAFCTYPKITKDGLYYIIGKDGHKIPGTNRYQFELMDQTVVIQKDTTTPKQNGRRRRPNMLMRVMKAFERMMKSGCHL